MKQSHLGGTLWTVFCLLNTCVFPAHSMAISGQGTWETTLEGRDLDGNAATFEAYYDNVLDITWLADANYALTSGDDDNGKFTWEEANAWAAGLVVHGISGWRLPTLSPIDGNSFNTTVTNNGTTDAAWTWTTTDGSDGGWRDINGNPVSELGHMYYVHLGNLGSCTPNGDGSSTSCVLPEEGFGMKNTGPFLNVESLYWTDTAVFNSQGWNFYHGTGRQKWSQTWRNSNAWAVHDGDVAVSVLRCDLNDNGEVDAGDLSQVMRMVVDDIADDLDCDINNSGLGDGVISTADLIVATRIVLGIIPAISN